MGVIKSARTGQRAFHRGGDMGKVTSVKGPACAKHRRLREDGVFGNSCQTPSNRQLKLNSHGPA